MAQGIDAWRLDRRPSRGGKDRNGVTTLFAGFRHQAADGTCAPLIRDGASLAALQARLRARAGAAPIPRHARRRAVELASAGSPVSMIYPAIQTSNQQFVVDGRNFLTRPTAVRDRR